MKRVPRRKRKRDLPIVRESPGNHPILISRERGDPPPPSESHPCIRPTSWGTQWTSNNVGRVPRIRRLSFPKDLTKPMLLFSRQLWPHAAWPATSSSTPRSESLGSSDETRHTIARQVAEAANQWFSFLIGSHMPRQGRRSAIKEYLSPYPRYITVWRDGRGGSSMRRQLATWQSPRVLDVNALSGNTCSNVSEAIAFWSNI